MAVATTTKHTPNETLQRRMQEHRAEIKRYREQQGDPAEALGVLLRERFGVEALHDTYFEWLENPYAWLENDDDIDE